MHLGGNFGSAFEWAFWIGILGRCGGYILQQVSWGKLGTDEGDIRVNLARLVDIGIFRGRSPKSHPIGF